MPYIAAMSELAVDALLENNGDATRLADLVKHLRRCGQPFWSSRFVHGKNAENRVKLDLDDGLLKQSAKSIKGKHQTKKHIVHHFQQLRGIGRFYSQHGLIVLSRGGRSRVLHQMGVKEVQSTVFVGDGDWRILGFLRSLQGSPLDLHWSVC